MTRRSPREIEQRIDEIETSDGGCNEFRAYVEPFAPDDVDRTDVFDCPDCGDDCILCMELIDI